MAIFAAKNKDVAAYNIWAAGILIDELTKTGVNYFCISPGSRSTPLTLAAADHSAAKTTICYDERGGAFHALGYARATGRAAALICSSGTAVANYFPAIIEADSENLPMLILSADRPFELRQAGANQTIRQTNMFGQYVRYHLDLPVIQGDVQPSWLQRIADYAAAMTFNNPAGPVHINIPFREPLAPDRQECRKIFAGIRAASTSNKPATSFHPGALQPAKDALGLLASTLKQHREGIILCGRMPYDRQADKRLLGLAKKIGWPVFADITSALRLMQDPVIIHHYDVLLQADGLRKRLSGLPIVQFGKEPVSKRWLKFREKHKPVLHVVIDPDRDRIDPLHQIDHQVSVGAGPVVQALLPLLPDRGPAPILSICQEANRLAQSTIAGMNEDKVPVNEISAAVRLSTVLGKSSALFVGSSMPVRDMDMFALAGSGCRIGANRGASGIDGTIASACGFAVGLKHRVFLILGDLSAIHDLNALQQVAASKFPLTIIIVNNCGGGIFSFLPISNHGKTFEQFFSTPHNFNFKGAAEMFGIPWTAPSTNAELSIALTESMAGTFSNIIELASDRKINRVMHQKILSMIEKAVEQSINGSN